MSTRDVRILLVGDSQVGKTSLILSLVSEEFPDEVPMRAEEITIPADVTPEKVPTHIVDYCEDEQTDDILADEIVKANVVCIVYDVTDEETIERITTFWLPLIRSVTEDEEHIKPVVIVGNKSDLSDTSTMDIVLPIMNDYSEVETCVECSAKNLKNISEMFYYAQKAVLHPTAPLYSPDTKQIKPLCEMALTRIFKISDADGDGILNDTELNSFQKRCFNSPLQGQGLQDVKNVVRKNIEGGIRNGGLTLKGFVFLHTLFIQRGRHETTWAVLRKFGYGEDLQLRSDYLCPKGIDVGTDSTVELSDAGYEFLIDLFNKYDKDQDEALSPVELEELFEMCPTNPWGDEVIHAAETNSKGWITLQGFLAQWTLTTFLDYTRTLAYLAYFGYAHGEVETQLSTAIAVTRSKSIDIQKKSTTRSVFQCYVFGPPGVGKTTFLQSFLDRSLENSDLEHLTTPYVINLVEVQRQEKYLVLREIEWENSGLLLHDRRCDVACFLYNSNDAASFSQIVQLREKLPKTLPCLFVATKSDLTTVKQEYEQQPLMYTTLNKLPPPQPFSINGPPEGNKKIYSKLAQMAVYPHLCGPNADTMATFWVIAGVGAAAAAVIGFLGYRYLRKSANGL
ncbi:mitochondrial Rho GTPase 1-A isoform X2 [Nematostella vectensis]|uniref:mitochondrial Rho GTPase 1-A isoform X2 n=1 Tax=Nematostella vectensis TaxID=45351 RepID=UPI002077576F|nr:mitochondrial Rho GTPase 1-A isoform X2 [Nematostella vectensis]